MSPLLIIYIFIIINIEELAIIILLAVFLQEQLAHRARVHRERKRPLSVQMINYFRASMTSEHHYLLSNDTGKMARETWYSLFREFDERTAERQGPYMMEPINRMDSFEEALPSPLAANEEEEGVTMLEINGRIIDLEVEVGYHYDYLSLKAQKVIVLKKFWASTAEIFWDGEHGELYACWRGAQS